MTGLVCEEGLREIRQGASRYCLRGDLSLEKVLEAMAQPGEVLKQSRKATVRRVGAWVIKESGGFWGCDWIKHTFQKTRYRRAWIGAHYLRRHGVLVPEPIAFIERGYWGIITGNTLISQYLEGYRNVEKFMLALVQRGAGKDTLELFLERLADTVNKLCASGVYHGDLWGKTFSRSTARNSISLTWTRWR